MTTNISGFGLSAVITASSTFPNGFPVTAFADDADAMDSPDFTYADTGSGLNGHLIIWSKANGLEIAMNVIPTSEDDQNLAALFEANRVGKSKSSAKDTIGIVWTYPNGDRTTFSNGTVLVGSLLPQVASSGRLKSRQYRFKFESYTNVQASS
jgi:hypothetical protein